MNKKIKSYLLTESSYPAKLVATKAPVGSPLLLAGLPSGTHGQTLCYDLLLILCSLLVPLGLFVLFDGCKDNPVVNNNTTYKFDTARFNWKTDTVSVGIVDIWGIDTNYIIFEGYDRLTIYDRYNYKDLMYYPPYFFNRPQFIGGTSNNNIFIGGIDAYSKPIILKYDGSALINIPIPDSGQAYAILSIYIYNENEIWFGTDKGRFFMYDGDNLHNYFLDTLHYVIPLFKNSQNELIIAVGDIIKNNQQNETYHKIYQYLNGNWNLIFTQIQQKNGIAIIKPINFLNNVYGWREDGLYKFETNKFNKIIQTEDFNLWYQFGGSSEQDIMVMGGIWNSPGVWILHWNGLKWSKELNDDTKFFFYPIKKIKEKYIAVRSEFPDNRSLIHYATKK